MSLSFIIQGGECETEQHSVKLFMRVSSGRTAEIPRTIILLDDDLDESEQFDPHSSNAEVRICAHVIGKILSAPENPESLVAWYATVGFASFILATSRKGHEIRDTLQRGKSIELTTESVLDILSVENWETGERFLLLSGSAIECFLLQELDNNPLAIKSVRGRIRDKTESYLEELRFPSNIVRNVHNEIDRIDAPFLKQHGLWIAGNPNAFWHSWCNYFRNLDVSDLSLFRPSKPLSITKAYRAIRAQYRSHKDELSRLNGRKDDYIERSIRLIDALPEVSSISELEIRAVFHEVIKGLLEWAYHNSDGKYEMSEYVKLALEGEDLTFRLSENDVEKLHSSWIWPNIKRLGRPRTP